MVDKMSNLVLRMMILVRDAKTGAVIAMARASMRGDTDETWTRTLDWLVRPRMLAPTAERGDDIDAGVPAAR